MRALGCAALKKRKLRAVLNVQYQFCGQQYRFSRGRVCGISSRGGGGGGRLRVLFFSAWGAFLLPLYHFFVGHLPRL